MTRLEYKIHQCDDLSYTETVMTDNKPVGDVMARVEGRTAILRHLRVLTLYRGEGLNIAFNLYCHMLHWAELYGIREIITEVVPEDQIDYERTVSFLEKLGFQCILETKDSVVKGGTRKFGFFSEL